VRILLSFLLAGVALLSVAGGYAIASRAQSSEDRVTFGYTQHHYNRSRIAVASSGRNALLEHLTYTTRGGNVQVEWYDGAVTPLQPRTGLSVALVIDGRRVAATLHGGLHGVYETRPGWLLWFGHLSAGEHVIDIRAVRTDTGWAVPYADPSTNVVDNLTVTEVHGS
jgi:hypothetical protein